MVILDTFLHPTLWEVCGEDARDWEPQRLLPKLPATPCHLFTTPANASSCQVEEARSTLPSLGRGVGQWEETPSGFMLQAVGKVLWERMLRSELEFEKAAAWDSCSASVSLGPWESPRPAPLTLAWGSQVRSLFRAPNGSHNPHSTRGPFCEDLPGNRCPLQQLLPPPGPRPPPHPHPLQPEDESAIPRSEFILSPLPPGCSARCPECAASGSARAPSC